ncbi:MAG: MBL fold metallo-hydrolase [Planctomycetes bacterium]|nr:MBL fold metallo-hydrolase [Planctomycetota bacterium]
MRCIPLQSGSAGNCTYVESQGVRLLIDAGISASRARKRLSDHGVDIADIDAVLITHEHSDHIGAAGVFARKFGLPLYLTEKTWRAARDQIGLSGEPVMIGDNQRIDFGAACGEPTPPPAGGIRCFRAGDVLDFGPVRVETLATPHDSVDGVVYCVDDGRARLGVCTDFGHVFAGLRALVASLDGVVMESNYDERMLDAGPYPMFLKRRISGPRGHISNRESAELLASDGHRLRWACLAHLSENNNRPELAMDAHRAALADSLALHLTERYGASMPLEL